MRVALSIAPLLSLAACSEQPLSVTHDFVHVTKTLGTLGGMPQVRESAYVDSSGFLQTSRETSDNEILELREDQTSDSSIIAGLKSQRDKIESLHFRSVSSDKVVDYVREWIYVSLGFVGSSVLVRKSLASDVPDDTAKLLGLSEKPFGPLKRELPLVNAEAGDVYLRAIVLSPQSGKQVRRDKLTVSLDGATTSSKGALARALESPGRLIRVGLEPNPFSAFHSRFVPRRSTLVVEIGSTVLQVRSFLVDESSSNLSPEANE